MYPRTGVSRPKLNTGTLLALLVCLALWAGIVYALALVFNSG